MDRVLLCLLCITAMSSVLAQDSYPKASKQFLQRSSELRKSMYNRPIADDLKTLDAREHKIFQEHAIENGKAKREVIRKAANNRRVERSPPSNVIEIPEECKEEYYCETALNYPQETAKQLVLNGTVSVRVDGPSDDVINVVHRLNAENNNMEIALCQGEKKTIYPKIMYDRHNKPYHVVNPDDKQAQGFFVELCHLNADKKPGPCSNIVVPRPDYANTCKQNFVYRMTDVIEYGTHAVKELKIPSNCGCVGLAL